MYSKECYSDCCAPVASQIHVPSVCVVSLVSYTQTTPVFVSYATPVTQLVSTYTAAILCV